MRTSGLKRVESQASAVAVRMSGAVLLAIAAHAGVAYAALTIPTQGERMLDSRLTSITASVARFQAAQAAWSCSRG